MLTRTLCLCLLATAAASLAQTAATPQSITVTTTVEPLPLDAADRSVTVLDPHSQPLLLNNPIDLLRQDASLNLQARGGNGVQTDLSIRGATFEQSLILLNGLRINDPETGHLNLDLPIPFDAIDRIDVLHGSGSTFYGSDALAGAVNLITSQPTLTSLTASTGFGNYNSLEHHLRAALRTHALSEQLTASRDTSDGFLPDRNYSSNAIAAETWLTLRPGTTDILLAASDRPYGANLFYGPYDSWERTKGWFASIQQQLGPSTAASFGYRRHSDLFVLFLDNPTYYRNNHIVSSYESALRRADTFGPNTTLSYGLEADGDTIHSSNLGHHARNQGAGYANLSLRALRRFSLSLGAREEILSGGTSVFSPSLAAAYALTNSLRLRASAGHGFRLPTYLDLYYADPATIGNPNLKPESSWSYESGLDWNPGGRFALSATAFRLQESNTIDYSKYNPAQPWQANNVPSFRFTGAEATLHLRLTNTQQLQLSYTATHAAPPPTGLISEYAFNYATQNALLLYTAQPFPQLILTTQLNIVQKTTQTAYPLWDLSLARNHGHLRPYLRLLNLSNTGYQEIPGVPLQGRTIMGGAELNWSPTHH